jgi:hypothetical protein
MNDSIIEGHARHDIGRAARSTLVLVALGALLASSWQRLRSTHQRRLGSRSAPLPPKLQTWEGEGGRPEPESDTRADDSRADRTPGTSA